MGLEIHVPSRADGISLLVIQMIVHCIALIQVKGRSVVPMGQDVSVVRLTPCGFIDIIQMRAMMAITAHKTRLAELSVALM